MLEAQGITLTDCAGCPAFVLRDDRVFFGTGYKVLHNQESEHFASCARARLNGKLQLVYFTNAFSKLVDFCATASSQACQQALLSAVSAVQSVDGNGFLSMQNVVLDPALVYVDTQTSLCKLLYLPVNIPVSGATPAQVAQALYRLCWAALSARGCAPTASADAMPGYASGDIAHLRAVLQNPIGAARHATMQVWPSTRPASEKPSGAVDGPASATTNAATQKPPAFAGAAAAEKAPNSAAPSPVQDTYPSNELAVSYNLTVQGPVHAPATYRISDARTVVGKSPLKAQCVIRSSQAVSRAHCEFLIALDGALSVTDLGSKNGTFVNGKRIAPHVTVSVANGATVRLADVPLLVEKAG